MHMELFRAGTPVWAPNPGCVGKVVSARRSHGCPAVYTIEMEPSGKRLTVDQVMPLPVNVTVLTRG